VTGVQTCALPICIALGIRLFGDNEFGWRITAAIAGTLILLIAARLAH